MSEPWHGTMSGYNVHRCRCDRCRAANATYQRKRRERCARGIRGDEPWHGTYGGYINYRCRCDACRRANTEQMRDYRRRGGILRGDTNSDPGTAQTVRGLAATPGGHDDATA